MVVIFHPKSENYNVIFHDWSFLCLKFLKNCRLGRLCWQNAVCFFFFLLMRFASETWRRRQPFPLFTTLSMTVFHFLFDDVNVICNSDSLVFASCRMCQTRTLFIYLSFVFLYTAAGALSCVGTQILVNVQLLFGFFFFFCFDLV